VHQVIARNAEPAGLTRIRRGITGHPGRRGSGIEKQVVQANSTYRDERRSELFSDR